MGRPARVALLLAAIVVAVLVGLAGTLAAMSALGPAPLPAALGTPRFAEEAMAAGIDHAYAGEGDYFVGGGVAVFDCDGDGRQDVYLAGGSDSAALYRNGSPVGGALRFERVVDPLTDLDRVTGAYPIDIDGDGIVDLAVLRRGENVLLRGTGDCRFERANERWSFDGGDAWTVAFSATWEGANRLPTLAVGNYLGLAADGTSTFDCADSELHRPDADGSGYAQPIALTPGYCTLSMLFSDWDRTGHRDLRLTNDRHYYTDGSEQLWHVAAGEPPRPYTTEDGWQPMQIWGMGIASQDLTGDGRPEVYLTSQGDNKLQTLVEGAVGPDYRDVALRRGVTAHRPFAGGDVLPSTAWHPEFADVNDDGYPDLFVSKGNVDAMPDFATKDPSNLFLGGPDGTFTEVAEEAGILSYARGRGAALADFNLDGMLDLIEVNRRENVKLWRNVGAGDARAPLPMGDWIALRVEQPGGDRDAIGAWVEVRTDGRTTVREITIGGGHAGGQLGWLHVGLGAAGTTQAAEVRVQWPDGTVGPWQAVAVNAFSLVMRDAPATEPWAPPS